MKNVDMQLDGDTLVIRVDLTKDFGESKSGKSITIASTEGNVSVPGGRGGQDRSECVQENVRNIQFLFLFLSSIVLNHLFEY